MHVLNAMVHGSGVVWRAECKDGTAVHAFRFRNTQVMWYIHIIMTPMCIYVGV